MHAFLVGLEPVTYWCAAIMLITAPPCTNVLPSTMFMTYTHNIATHTLSAHTHTDAPRRHTQRKHVSSGSCML